MEKGSPLILHTPNSKIRSKIGNEIANPEDYFAYINGNSNNQLLVSPNLQIKCEYRAEELSCKISPFFEDGFSRFSTTPQQEKLDPLIRPDINPQMIESSLLSSISYNLFHNKAYAGKNQKISLTFSILESAAFGSTIPKIVKKSCRSLEISQGASLSFEINERRLLAKREIKETKDAQTMFPEFKEKKQTKPVVCEYCGITLQSYRHLGGHTSRNHPGASEKFHLLSIERKNKMHKRLFRFILNNEYYKSMGINYIEEKKTSEGRRKLKKLLNYKEYKKLSTEIKENFDRFFDKYSLLYSDIISIGK